MPYATASVWGTGIDPIHAYYGEGPPLRMLGRDGHLGSSPVARESPRDREYQQAADSQSLDPPQEVTWGYDVDYGPDSFGQGPDSPISLVDTTFAVTQFMDDHPSWNVAPEQARLRSDASTQAPWGTGGGIMRAIRAGAARYRLNPEEQLTGQGDGYQPISAEPSNSNPTETVSEGWLNKTTTFVAEAEPSSVEQYEVQTSMRQRFGIRDNMRAVARATDDERSRIASRVEAMIEKVYSTGERSYDMFPYQIDQIERPFRNRTAGLGPAEWMQANEYSPVTPVRRTPPPDPSMGPAEVSDDYGYTAEDTMYYG